MHIALLWGINISGKNKVPMANLKIPEHLNNASHYSNLFMS